MQHVATYLWSVFLSGMYVVCGSYFGWLTPEKIEVLSYAIWIPIINGFIVLGALVYHVGQAIFTAIEYAGSFTNSLIAM